MRQKQCAVRWLAVETPGTEIVNSSMFRDQNSKQGKRYTAKLACTVPRSAVRTAGTKKVRCWYSSLNPTEQKGKKKKKEKKSIYKKWTGRRLAMAVKKKKKKDQKWCTIQCLAVKLQEQKWCTIWCLAVKTPGTEIMHNPMFSSQNFRNRNDAQSKFCSQNSTKIMHNSMFSSQINRNSNYAQVEV